jgi:protein TonB
MCKACFKSFSEPRAQPARPVAKESRPAARDVRREVKAVKDGPRDQRRSSGFRSFVFLLLIVGFVAYRNFPELFTEAGLGSVISILTGGSSSSETPSDEPGPTGEAPAADALPPPSAPADSPSRGAPPSEAPPSEPPRAAPGAAERLPAEGIALPPPKAAPKAAPRRAEPARTPPPAPPPEPAREEPVRAEKPPAPEPPPVMRQAPAPTRVGGEIKAPQKTRHVNPVYPPSAQAARVQGVVIIEATIDPAGRVREAKVLRSIPLLDQPALDAVKQWEYEPTLVNGVAVPVVMTVTVRFSLR